MIMTTPTFPFDINPAGFVPDTYKPIHLNVLGVGSMNFNTSEVSIAQMAAMIIVRNTGREVVVGDTKDFLTVTAWDLKKRALTVRVNN